MVPLPASFLSTAVDTIGVPWYGAINDVTMRQCDKRSVTSGERRDAMQCNAM